MKLLIGIPPHVWAEWWEALRPRLARLWDALCWYERPLVLRFLCMHCFNEAMKVNIAGMFEAHMRHHEASRRLMQELLRKQRSNGSEPKGRAMVIDLRPPDAR